MNQISEAQLGRIIEEYGSVIPGLSQPLKENIEKEFAVENQPDTADVAKEANFTTVRIIEEEQGIVASERIIVATAGVRPVVRIKDNKVTTEFLGRNTSNSAWAPVLLQCSEALNKAIPAVGRIELNNGDLSWVGTGWMIEEGIIVTNAHVAELFSKPDAATSSFVFKPGLLGGTVSSKIDFLEEENNVNSLEHPISNVIWIAPTGETDVAFLKVVQGAGMPALPSPVELADSVENESAIAAIGYPAKDDTIRDQELVISIFGNDVYDKKRLAPGKVKTIDEKMLHHDCSTLGGNSGSLLIDLKTGKAVGLHQGGFLNDSANIGVSVTHLKVLLSKIKKNITENALTPQPIKKPQNELVMPVNNESPEIKINLQIPLEISIKLGNVVTSFGTAALPLPAATDPFAGQFGNVDAALEVAKTTFESNPDVVKVRKGYRFKNGWITDEEVIVVELKEKLSLTDLLGTGKRPITREILGVGVDVRTAVLPDLLDSMGIDLTVLERKSAPARYQEPPGFDDLDSDMFLRRIRAKMDAIFHVSPDAGFSTLSSFLSRVTGKLTATIYEWQPNHISDAIEEAIERTGGTLKMVTQRTGVAESDATISAVNDMKARLGDRFEHVWASTRGRNRLIPNSYHIKVATRDGEEFWLSSGNWKNSNQPENPTGLPALKQFNREWHAVIRNKKLTGLFERYIDYDFTQAKLFPTEINEAFQLPEVEFFIQDTSGVGQESIAGVTYEDTLVIVDEVLDIQPLLTPDRDADGDRLFIKQATNMVRRATRSVYIQNQSFNITKENNEELDEFFDAVSKKQRAITDVKIIFRDAKDYGRQSDLEKQQEMIELLKTRGFDTSRDRMRLQSKCHTKGIIVDSKEVLLGSQNITNGGALHNRDASLLVRNRKVAEFFEKVFLFDWDNLTHNEINESAGGLRIAQPGEATPEGFRRVGLAELLGERQ
ncbi:phospholipase D-like domain-containing protein [Dyadobacter arcticus]|uniref:phospholipase D n=1 Tax=Dyadobacter arcticus TaxID=1078754 RepID=A0ABX0UK38_9BACT|nr:phospholipase D-like domain-containing protein [Dyadobacter arcticus]NIJ52439.1 V8-like Glu-specific endopeptidase [Dyadobacter arcticus]